MRQLEFDFVSEIETPKEKIDTDAEMRELCERNSKEFHKIMDYYRIPMITRDEIRTLVRWS